MTGDTHRQLQLAIKKEEKKLGSLKPITFSDWLALHIEELEVVALAHGLNWQTE